MICTYDSLDKIQETRNTAYAVPPFDLAIMDEAHRIAGRPDKWAAVHDNQRIRADRRLYMTATPASSPPRTWPSPPTPPAPAAAPPPPGPAADLFTNSMDNEQVYGKRSGITRWPRRSRTAGHRTTASWCPPSPTPTCAAASTSRPPTPTARARTGPGAAHHRHLAVLRAMADHGLKKVLVYFNLTSDARLFARELPHTLRQLAATAPTSSPPPGWRRCSCTARTPPAARGDLHPLRASPLRS
ncbi:DEAD/DEAH box helicase family protein [Streptomyces microflavus]